VSTVRLNLGPSHDSGAVVCPPAPAPAWNRYWLLLLLLLMLVECVCRARKCVFMKLCGERRAEQRQRRARCSRRHHGQLERSRRPPASSHTHTHTRFQHALTLLCTTAAPLHPAANCHHQHTKAVAPPGFCNRGKRGMGL